MNLLWMDYVMIALPGILLTGWAVARILQAEAAGAAIAAISGLTGAETAALVLEAGGVADVEIVPASGELSNYYDAARRTLRLSPDVFEGRSLSAVAVAAHESGHAIQHIARYHGLMVRNAVVPVAVLGCQVCWIVIAAGFWLGMMRLIVLAIVLFGAHLLIQLASVPVERDASRRAREILRSRGLVTDEEEGLVGRVWDASAWRYVTSVLWGDIGRWSAMSRGWRRNGE